MPATSKTRSIAVESLKAFFVKHHVVYYWTFTIVDLCSKSEAEKRFKPLEDRIRRRKGEYLAFWELQERGAWHVHLVTTLYFDVNELRPWMVERKWGQQMFVKRVQARRVWVDGEGWQLDDRDSWRLVKYLVKYLTKSFRASACDTAAWARKKVFGGTTSAKIGNTRFAWNPWVTGKAGAMFYAYGRQFWAEIFGSESKIKSWAQHVRACMRLGYEILNWADYDPFCEPP